MDLIISIGSSRHAKQWRAKKMTWDDLVKKLSQSIITEETAAEYRRMTKDEKAEVKDVGGFVGGHIKNKGRRVKGAVEKRYLLTLMQTVRSLIFWDRSILKLATSNMSFTRHTATLRKHRGTASYYR